MYLVDTALYFVSLSYAAHDRQEIAIEQKCICLKRLDLFLTGILKICKQKTNS